MTGTWEQVWYYGNSGTLNQGHQMAKIKYYEDYELEGLTDDELDIRRLVSRIIHIDKYADPSELELESKEHLQGLLVSLEGSPVDRTATDEGKVTQIETRREKPAKPVGIVPRTIEDAYTLINGQLMRRVVNLIELEHIDGTRYTREVERLVQCGDRVQFAGKMYSKRIVEHYLKTGEMLHRAPRTTKGIRYRARVRTPNGLVHLGYFATVEERDAAVFAYKLGLGKVPSK